MATTTGRWFGARRARGTVVSLGRRFWRAIRLAAAIILIAALPVRAGVRIDGARDAIRLEAREATLADILAALQARFPFDIRGKPAIRVVSGTYQGPLRAVLLRLLAGYDYVIEAKGDKLNLLLLSDGGLREAAPAPAMIIRRRVD